MEISIVGLTKNDFASCLDTLEDIGTRQERVLLLRELLFKSPGEYQRMGADSQANLRGQRG